MLIILVSLKSRGSDYYILHYFSGTQIQLASESGLLPSISSVINLADQAEKDNFVVFTSISEDLADLEPGMLDTTQVL